MRLDQAASKDVNPAKPVDGQAVVVDRNELLKQIMSSRPEKKLE